MTSDLDTTDVEAIINGTSNRKCAHVQPTRLVEEYCDEAVRVKKAKTMPNKVIRQLVKPPTPRLCESTPGNSHQDENTPTSSLVNAFSSAATVSASTEPSMDILATDQLPAFEGLETELQLSRNMLQIKCKDVVQMMFIFDI